MPTYYMAVDIGASNGRNILGWLEDGKIRLEVVHRFENGGVEKDGHLVWEVDRFFRDIKTGLKRCGEMGKKPVSVGVDTWGVDFVLLDAAGERLGDAVAYRDRRTEGMEEKVFEIISEQQLYARNGIQRHIFNTIYQLYALKTRQPELLARADSFLMMSEYMHYLLTGVKMNEYTNATTTQLVGGESRQWDTEVMDMLGIPSRMFGPLHHPGELVGTLRKQVADEIGYNLEVVLPPTHDTASAVLAVPAEGDDAIYISSGTWSLMGIEIMTPDCRDMCRQRHFTNEGGYAFRYRFLKNIMGMWLIQSIRKELPAPKPSFGEMPALAKSAWSFESIIDPNDSCLFAPDSMIRAIGDCCEKTGQPRPANAAETIACAYKSLAKSYAGTVREIEELTGKKRDRINIMGGGSRNDFLNRLTAEYSGLDVYAGPEEATAIGNILSQMLRAGEFADLAEARRAVRDSFAVEKVKV